MKRKEVIMQKQTILQCRSFSMELTGQKMKELK